MLKITQTDDPSIHHIQYHTDTPNLHQSHQSHDHNKWFDEFILDLSHIYPSDKNSQLHQSPSSTVTRKTLTPPSFWIPAVVFDFIHLIYIFSECAKEFSVHHYSVSSMTIPFMDPSTFSTPPSPSQTLPLSPMISRPKTSSHLSIHTSFRSFCAIAHCNPPTLSKVPCSEVTSDEWWKSLGGWPKNLSKPYSSRWHVTELSIQCSTMTLWTTRWNVHNRLPPVLVVEYYFMEYARHTKDFHRDFDAWCSPSKSKHPIYD